MMFDPQQIPRRRPDLLWQTTADGVVIVSPAEGQVRVLNRLGTTIWQMIDGCRSLSDIEETLLDRYGDQADAGRIHRDFLEFIQELARREMVTWITEAGA